MKLGLVVDVKCKDIKKKGNEGETETGPPRGGGWGKEEDEGEEGGRSTRAKLEGKEERRRGR